MAPPDAIRCADACGRAAASEADAQQSGWLRLQITGRYRCPACARALDLANRGKEHAGQDSAGQDRA